MEIMKNIKAKVYELAMSTEESIDLYVDSDNVDEVALKYNVIIAKIVQTVATDIGYGLNQSEITFNNQSIMGYNDNTLLSLLEYNGFNRDNLTIKSQIGKTTLVIDKILNIMD